MTDKGARQTEVVIVEGWFTKRLAEIEKEEQVRAGGLRAALAAEAKKVDAWYQEQRKLFERVHGESIGDAKREYGARKAALQRSHKANLQSLEAHHQSKLDELRAEKMAKLEPLEGTLGDEMGAVEKWKADAIKAAEDGRQERLEKIEAKGLAEQEEPQQQNV